MSEANWGTGDVISRKVGNNIQEILPANLPDSQNVYFDQDGILRGEFLPENAVEGTVHIAGGVGDNSQLKVTVEKTLSLKYVSGEGDPVERTVELTFYRTESQDLGSLAPFEYTVQIQEDELESSRTETRTVSIADVATDQYLGREEAAAALVLTEIVANKKASSAGKRTERISHAGSLARMGSINTTIDKNRLRFDAWALDWETLNELLGPEAETVVSKTSVETTSPEKRQAATSKGIDFLADDGILAADSGMGTDSSLQSSIDDLLADTVTNVFEEGDYIISRTRSELLEAKESYDSLVESFPDEFIRSLEQQNFGDAKAVVADDTFDRMLMAYTMQQLIEGVNELLAAQDSIEDLSLAVTAFANGIAADDIEMAERGLQNASDAYLQVTKHLMQEGKETIESLRPVLQIHDLLEPFNQHLTETAELTGTELAFYESAIERLEEAAREQHERAEKAREVFYIYT